MALGLTWRGLEDLWSWALVGICAALITYIVARLLLPVFAGGGRAGRLPTRDGITPRREDGER